MEANEYELIVSPGNNPLWMRLVAAVFFTIIFVLLYDMSVMFYDYGWCEGTYRRIPKYIESVTYCLSAGVVFSVVKTVLIDTDKDKLVSRFSIGLLSRDILSKVPDLEYVAIFLDGKGCYQVNLWYKGNRHYKMYVFDEKPPAFEFAQQVSKKLNIDLLDATEKGNSKWIDKETDNEISAQ
jgi:hypothetical protein